MVIIYEAESYRIMGACFEVYQRMGRGFLEAVYQECLGIEFIGARDTVRVPAQTPDRLQGADPRTVLQGRLRLLR